MSLILKAFVWVTKFQSRREFGEKEFDRSGLVRPSTTMRSRGDHDWNTNKREAFKAYDDARRTQPQKYEDNLKSKGLSFEDGTTGKSHYTEHKVCIS